MKRGTMSVGMLALVGALGWGQETGKKTTQSNQFPH
jgi:hypothetical protein